MAILRDSEDIYDDESEALSLELNLLRLERKEAFEGWIAYRLIVREAERTLVEREGAIHEDDVAFIEKLLIKLPENPEEFAPMEPDFRLHLKRITSIADEDKECVLTCMVNYGEVRHKFYGQSALGVALRITEDDAQKFARELQDQRVNLTKDIVRS